MFRYERVTSTGKFTIVAKIVFLLKKIYKGDDLCTYKGDDLCKNLSCFGSALLPQNENKHREI